MILFLFVLLSQHACVTFGAATIQGCHAGYENALCCACVEGDEQLLERFGSHQPP